MYISMIRHGGGRIICREEYTGNNGGTGERSKDDLWDSGDTGEGEVRGGRGGGGGQASMGAGPGRIYVRKCGGFQMKKGWMLKIKVRSSLVRDTIAMHFTTLLPRLTNEIKRVQRIMLPRILSVLYVFIIDTYLGTLYRSNIREYLIAYNDFLLFFGGGG